MQNYVYDAKFLWNILVVGRTIFFGKLVQAEWVCRINLNKKREADTQSCFDCIVKFHYSKDKNYLKNLLEQFSLQYGEIKDNDIYNDSYGKL